MVFFSHWLNHCVLMVISVAATSQPSAAAPLTWPALRTTLPISSIMSGTCHSLWHSWKTLWHGSIVMRNLVASLMTSQGRQACMEESVKMKMRMVIKDAHSSRILGISVLRSVDFVGKKWHYQWQISVNISLHYGFKKKIKNENKTLPNNTSIIYDDDIGTYDSSPRILQN